MFSILRQCQIFVTSLRKAVKSGGEVNEQGDGQRQRFSAGFVPGRQYIHKTRMVGCKLPTDTSMTCWAGQVSSMHRMEETTWHNTMMVINIKTNLQISESSLERSFPFHQNINLPPFNGNSPETMQQAFTIRGQISDPFNGFLEAKLTFLITIPMLTLTYAMQLWIR